jgi:hypothetical protein
MKDDKREGEREREREGERERERGLFICDMIYNNSQFTCTKS